MIIIVGLGNPGKKFNNTPHNLGFLILDNFRGENNFPEFKLLKKFDSLISEEVIGGEKIILAKPQTFMNESGKAVKKITNTYKLKTKTLCVVHDDIDLSLDEIKIVKNRGSAGHKGVESIIKKIGSKDFIRIRIGVISKTGKPKEPEKFVLKKFSKQEKPIIDSIIEKASNIIETVIKEGLEQAMNEYNK